MATSAPKSVPKVVPKIVPAGEADEAVPEKKSKKKLFIVLALILILAGGGGAGWYFTRTPAKHDPKAEAEHKAKTEAAKPPVFLAMEAFTVNLTSEGSEQFLQTVVTLQVADQAQVDLIKLYMPLVRSRLLLLLTSKKASELLSVDGKNKLAKEIAEQINKPFTPAGPVQQVSEVFFNSFVIQ